MMILHCKNGTVEVNDVTIRALKKAWPTKDIDTELAKMHLWLFLHENRRPTYFWSFIRNWMRKAPDVNPPPPPPHANWWKSEEATLEVSRGLGLYPRPGETLSTFRERVGKALAASRH